MAMSWLVARMKSCWRAACAFCSNIDAMAKIFANSTGLVASLAPLSTAAENSPAQSSDEDMVDVPAATGAAAALGDFRAQSLTYWHRDKADLVEAINVNNLSNEGKIAAMTWLRSTVNSPSGSYLVAEAAASKLGELGMATPDLVRKLGTRAAARRWAADKCMDTLIDLGVSFQLIKPRRRRSRRRGRGEEGKHGGVMIAELRDEPSVDLGFTDPEALVVFVLERLQAQNWCASVMDWAVRQPELLAIPQQLLQSLLGRDPSGDPEPVLVTLRQRIDAAAFEQMLQSVGTDSVVSKLCICLHLALHAPAEAKQVAAQLILPLLNVATLEALFRSRMGKLDTRGVQNILRRVAELQSHCSATDAKRWRCTLITFTRSLVARRERKNDVPRLMQAIAALAPPSSEVRELLRELFSRSSDDTRGYWECDAVVPSFAFTHTCSSWGYEVLASFIVFKSTQSGFKVLLWNGAFDQFVLSAERFTEPQQQWAVWACAWAVHITAEARPVNLDGKFDTRAMLESFGLARFSPEFVCLQLFADTPPPPITVPDVGTLDTCSEQLVAPAESRALAFLDLVGCVLTLRRDGSSTLHLDTRDVPLSIADRMKEAIGVALVTQRAAAPSRWTSAIQALNDDAATPTMDTAAISDEYLDLNS
ncbi:hypothetical protein HKX48_007959 [Thoreauomyces humboldtii]|nr:hypothetical protein HKX48_007959 [Thoreauomyces humboldtii]